MDTLSILSKDCFGSCILEALLGLNTMVAIIENVYIALVNVLKIIAL